MWTNDGRAWIGSSAGQTVHAKSANAPAMSAALAAKAVVQPHVLSRVDEAITRRRAEQRNQQLLARIQSVVHELNAGTEPVQQPNVEPDIISAGPFHMSPWQQTVRVGELVIRLTAAEMHLLAFLLQHAGQVLTYRQITQGGMGSEQQDGQAAELIKPHIYHLRQKLEPDPSNPRYILTVRGVGYMLVANANDQGAS